MKANIKTTFGWLNATQFFGALNDNIFKFLIILFLIGIIGGNEANSIAGKVGFIFVAPFILFSHMAGVIADRFSKNSVIVATKIIEIFIMLLGALAFYYESPLFLYIVVFLMSLQSTIFGPCKLGIIPELVKPENISKANSLLLTFSFIAIILGTGCAPFFLKIFNHNFILASLICVIFSIIGIICSVKIKTTPIWQSSKKFTPFFLKEIFHTYIYIAKDKYLLLAVLGASYFLFVGAFVQLNIIGYGISHLGLNKENSTYLFMVVAFGIGIGSFLAGKFSKRNIEFGIVPIGALGISFAAASLFFIHHLLVVIMMIFLLGISAGLFIIPLESFIQLKSPAHRRGEILAVSNFSGFIGVLAASALIIFLDQVVHISPATGFLIIAGLNLVLLIFSVMFLPDFLLRFIALVIMRVFYRIDVKGIENIPLTGPALLISNHISWVDALLLIATSQRRIRFMMERSIFSHKWLKPLFKLMGIIPVSEADSPKKIVASLINARKIMDEGYLVCIFAEGRISRSGNLNAFKKGFTTILKGRDYPVIPIYIGGAWGSIFSYYHGRLLSQLPKMIPYPVSIIFGKSMPAHSTASSVKRAVSELSSNWFDFRKHSRMSLATSFIKTARQNWKFKAMCDLSQTQFTFGKVLISAIALTTKLKPLVKNQKYVGVLFPASIGGALVNIALTLLGKVVVNINFTSGEDSIKSAIRQCDIQTIITSSKVIENLTDFLVSKKMVYIEDIFFQISFIDKIQAFFKAKFFPASLLDVNKIIAGDDTATVIFSSGTTAEPKGVELTHHNIISNIESLRMVLRLGGEDNLIAVLPFFHSFGFTATIWLPLISGFSVTYHSKPLDSSSIIKLIKRNRSSIMISTPTFLMSYTRKASKEDFLSLKYVIIGAAKLSRRLAENFKTKYGIVPLEGYGTTELSPMAAVNIPDVKIDGVRQVGTKLGSVGHPLPGISAKIVNIDTFEELDQGIEGLLLIKGPNVMKGYLDNSEKTKEVLVDGWYNTGDIAKIDKDGFITITDRLSRFSKIGGEMVPHVGVEDKYHELLDASEQVVAVTSIPDEKKGEQLAVLYIKEAGDAKSLHNLIQNTDIPNLWKPRKDNYVLVEKIAILGTGKSDLKKIKEIAKEQLKRE